MPCCPQSLTRLSSAKTHLTLDIAWLKFSPHVLDSRCHSEAVSGLVYFLPVTRLRATRPTALPVTARRADEGHPLPRDTPALPSLPPAQSGFSGVPAARSIATPSMASLKRSRDNPAERCPADYGPVAATRPGGDGAAPWGGHWGSSRVPDPSRSRVAPAGLSGAADAAPPAPARGGRVRVPRGARRGGASSTEPTGTPTPARTGRARQGCTTAVVAFPGRHAENEHLAGALRRAVPRGTAASPFDAEPSVSPAAAGPLPGWE